MILADLNPEGGSYGGGKDTSDCFGLAFLGFLEGDSSSLLSDSLSVLLLPPLSSLSDESSSLTFSPLWSFVVPLERLGATDPGLLRDLALSAVFRSSSSAGELNDILRLAGVGVESREAELVSLSSSVVLCELVAFNAPLRFGESLLGLGLVALRSFEDSVVFFGAFLALTDVVTDLPFGFAGSDSFLSFLSGLLLASTSDSSESCINSVLNVDLIGFEGRGTFFVTFFILEDGNESLRAIRAVVCAIKTSVSPYSLSLFD